MSSTGPNIWETQTRRRHRRKTTRIRKGTHGRHWLYLPNPPRMTYGTLRTITRILRETGQRMTGKPVEIGATFDPGGEFAVSDFKFIVTRRSPAERRADRTPGWNALRRSMLIRARTPAIRSGIPEGTSIGTFLGRQSQHFLKDLGFDYIWFSNGFGFSLSPWDVTGPLFQGKEFDASKAARVAGRATWLLAELPPRVPELPHRDARQQPDRRR